MNACPKEKLTKDKQKLIGHASEEQLKYYQDVEIADLRRITDFIWKNPVATSLLHERKSEQQTNIENLNKLKRITKKKFQDV